MNTELIYSDATKLAELIRTREISPVEVVKAHLDRIEAINPPDRTPARCAPPASGSGVANRLRQTGLT